MLGTEKVKKAGGRSTERVAFWGHANPSDVRFLSWARLGFGRKLGLGSSSAIFVSASRACQKNSPLYYSTRWSVGSVTTHSSPPQDNMQLDFFTHRIQPITPMDSPHFGPVPPVTRPGSFDVLIAHTTQVGTTRLLCLAFSSHVVCVLWI